MPTTITRKVKSLTQFISLVEGISSSWDRLRTTTHPWFRGQGNAGWALTPGLYRGPVDKYYERELVRDFRLHSHLLLERTPTNYLEWLFLMQHYGMPTRLLDWTESYLAALYFAVSDRGSTADGAVWVLDAWSLNDHAIGMQSVPTADHDSLKPYALVGGADGLGRNIAGVFPAAVRPPRANPRINAQRGSFTVHGSRTGALEKLVKDANEDKASESKIRLQKIIITGTSKKELRKELYLAGVTEAVIFPDLTGLCGEISYRYSKEYMAEGKEQQGVIRKIALKGVPGRGTSHTRSARPSSIFIARSYKPVNHKSSSKKSAKRLSSVGAGARKSKKK